MMLRPIRPNPLMPTLTAIEVLQTSSKAAVFERETVFVRAA